MKTSKINDYRISRILKQAVSLASLFSLLAGIVLFAPTRAEAAASQFDMTFGTAGKVVTDFGGFDSLYDLATQPDGKIVAVGFSNSDFAVVRYNFNGTPDTTFDGDGRLTTDLSGTDQASAVAIQNDGKIVAAGSCSGSICLARYNSTGSLDLTFNGSGKVITNLPDIQSGNDIVIQPDGKIVVVGQTFSGPLTEDFIVARYNPNGSLDTTFNTTGFVITPLLNTDSANAVALQIDGKIIAAGFSNQDFALVRYTATGALDTSFDTDGIVTTNFAGTDQSKDVIIQPDGKIILAGLSSNSDFALARYNADGSLDTTFDADGKVVADMGNIDDCFAVALQPNGKIVAVGNVEGGGIAVARLNSNGSLDTSFHGDGKLNTVITGDDIAKAVAIQNDGKIVIGGSLASGTVKFALARFLGDPQKSFTNFNAVVPPDRTVNTNPPGLPTNYPSIADINGATGTVTKVRVILTNVNHTFPNDLDIVLVGPNGQRTILMSDAGGGNPGVTGRTYIFDQSATDFPNNNPVSGIYKPFNNLGPAQIEPGGIDVFPAPGPGSANFGAANLDVFNGTNPNGIWRLYVVDDEAGDTGFFSTFTLEVTTTTSRLNNLTADFDGDGRADVSVYRPSNGTWFLQQSFAGFTGIAFGIASDRIVPADYDGDGRTDVAVYRAGTWFLNRSQLGFTGIAFGAADDIPLPGDFDGDGKADICVFRPSNGTWFYLRSSDGSFSGVQFGTLGDVPVAGDFDGDGRADIAVYRPSVGTWYRLNSSNNQFAGVQFGVAEDKPVPGDFDGDGKTDIAVWRPSNGTWYWLLSSTGGFTGLNFGASTDIPAQGDFDGDGKADQVVFRPSNGTWFLNRSTSGFTGIAFGTNGDKPAPSAFVP